MSRNHHAGDLEMAQSKESPKGEEPSLARPIARPSATRAEVEKYTFFNRKLKFDVNKHGDIYDKQWKKSHKEWTIDKFVLL